MRLLRVLLAGLITVTALVAGFFAAAVILGAGVVAYLVQLFWKRQRAVPRRATRGMNRPPSSMRTDDVIDVVTTNVPTDPAQQ